MKPHAAAPAEWALGEAECIDGANVVDCGRFRVSARRALMPKATASIDDPP
jgi:hypothetical protein